MDGLASEVHTDVTQVAHGRPAWRRKIASPLTVAGLVLLFYVGLTLVSFRAGMAVTDYALVAAKFAHQSTASSVITFDANFRYSPGGYDGQFYYFIALDPEKARYYVDNPAYRYERILYPLVARSLALGQPALIPYMLILANILAISGGTLLLAYWLRRRGVSPWLALIYGLFSGLLVAYQRDLTEPLGYGLVILAVCCFDFSRRRALWAGLCFGLAALSREITLLFALPYAVALLLAPLEASGTDDMEAEKAPADEQKRKSPSLTSLERITQRAFERLKEGITRNWRPVALMAVLAAGPYLVYKGFLLVWLGSSGMTANLPPNLLPFSGLVAMLPPRPDTLMQLMIVCAPGLVCFVLALWVVLHRSASASVEIWALLLNATFLVVMLRPVWYVEPSPATTRLGTGIVLAALLSVPAFDTLLQRDRRWLAVCAPAWLGYTCLFLGALIAPLLTHL